VEVPLGALGAVGVKTPDFRTPVARGVCGCVSWNAVTSLVLGSLFSSSPIGSGKLRLLHPRQCCYSFCIDILVVTLAVCGLQYETIRASAAIVRGALRQKRREERCPHVSLRPANPRNTSAAV